MHRPHSLGSSPLESGIFGGFQKNVETNKIQRSSTMENFRSRQRIRVVTCLDTIFSSILFLRALLYMAESIAAEAVARGANVDLDIVDLTRCSVWRPWMIALTGVCLLAKIVIPWDLFRASEMGHSTVRSLHAANMYRNFNVIDFLVMFSVTPFILLGTQIHWMHILSPWWLVPGIWFLMGVSRVVCGLVVCSFIQDVKENQHFGRPPSYAKVVEEQMA